MIKQTALSLGIPSGLVTLGGILLCILVHVHVSNITDGFTKRSDGSPRQEIYLATGSLWLIGVAYIIPGILGVLAALIQNKGLYIASIVVSIIALLIMALSSILYIVAFYFVTILNSSNCYDHNGVCMCRYAHQEFGYFKSCGKINKYYSLYVAVSFFLVFTWVALMVMLVLCCYYTCCAKTRGSEGIVLMPAQQPMATSYHNGPPAYTMENYPPPQKIVGQGAPSKF